MKTTTESTEQAATAMTPTQLLAHWKGHRNLTRRVIEAFPEKDFFNYSIGGMRTFSEMVMELLGIGGPGTAELATGTSSELVEHVDHGNSKQKMLQLWDEATVTINTNWSQINENEFNKEVKIFGQYEGTVLSSVMYFIDNEIHHRGQGYVYLRSLGVEPPFFYER